MFNQIIAFLKDFFGYFTTIYKAKNDAIIEQQKERLLLLEEQLRIQSGFTVEKVNERFHALKEYYDKHLTDWYEKSIETLNEEKQVAITNLDKEYQSRLAEEIRLRTELKKKYEIHINQSQEKVSFDSPISPKDIIGTFSVIGMNPGSFPSYRIGYFGKVDIKQLGETFSVTWTIDSALPTQIFQGTGILSRNVFSVAFNGLDGITGKEFTGLICYEVINNEILRGTWAGLGIGVAGEEQLRRTA
jgi:hypothetical protein